MITILGTTEIPQPEETQITVVMMTEILNGLEPGKALVLETESAKRGRILQSKLVALAGLLYGQNGLVHTKRLDQIVYVWLDAEAERYFEQLRMSKAAYERVG